MFFVCVICILFTKNTDHPSVFVSCCQSTIVKIKAKIRVQLSMELANFYTSNNTWHQKNVEDVMIKCIVKSTHSGFKKFCKIGTSSFLHN